MNKITIAACGRVGESTAQILAKEELCREILLLDIHTGVPEGVALDIQQSASLLRFDTRVTGSTDPAAMAVPAVLDQDGLVEIIELKLNPEEQADFQRSANLVRTDIELLT